MKITHTGYRPSLPDQLTTKTTTKPSQETPITPVRSAAVELSPAARQLQQLQSSSNDIDVARVQALREAIANGTLEVDTSRIADALFNSARDLLK